MKKYVKPIIVGSLLILAGGCANPLLKPYDTFVNKSVGPEYIKYVEKDENLSEFEKRIRKQNVEANSKLIEEYKNAGL